MNKVHNADGWCTTQVGRAQHSPVPLRQYTTYSSHKPTHRDTDGTDSITSTADAGGKIIPGLEYVKSGCMIFFGVPKCMFFLMKLPPP